MATKRHKDSRKAAHLVVVLKDGRIAESALVRELFARPASDYTRSLLAAMPGGVE
jgi:peptide/nickel transport system ATP-binding protein